MLGWYVQGLDGDFRGGNFVGLVSIISVHLSFFADTHVWFGIYNMIWIRNGKKLILADFPGPVY